MREFIGIVEDVEFVTVLELASTPPSLNSSVGLHSGNPHAARKAKADLQEDLGRLLMAAKPRLPRGLDKITASASLRFPTNRRRDDGNFSWLLEKSLGDALTGGGWLADDTHGQFTFTEIVFEAECGPARTLVTVTGIGRAIVRSAK